jgi:hypothetical protein
MLTFGGPDTSLLTLQPPTFPSPICWLGSAAPGTLEAWKLLYDTESLSRYGVSHTFWDSGDLWCWLTVSVVDGISCECSGPKQAFSLLQTIPSYQRADSEKTVQTFSQSWFLSKSVRVPEAKSRTRQESCLPVCIQSGLQRPQSASVTQRYHPSSGYCPPALHRLQWLLTDFGSGIICLHRGTNMPITFYTSSLILTGTLPGKYH